MTTDRKRDILINILFVAIILVAAYFIFKYLFVWLLPFIIGAIVAVALQRPVDYLAKKTPLKRTFWSIFLVIIAFSAICALCGFLFYRFYIELLELVKVLPSYITPLTDFLNNLSQDAADWFKDAPDMAEAIKTLPSSFSGSLINIITSLATGFGNIIVNQGPALLVTLGVTVVACCFVTKDYYQISSFFSRQLSTKNWELIVEVKNLFVKNILKFFRGYIIIMFITFCELLVGFLIIGVDYAAGIAFLVALVDILPVLGTGTVLIPWSIISLISGNYWYAASLLILYVVILIVRNILEPKIIGQQVGLHPLLTLIAMYVGLQTMGLLGLVAFPVTLIILINLQETGKIKIWK